MVPILPELLRSPIYLPSKNNETHTKCSNDHLLSEQCWQ